MLNLAVRNVFRNRGRAAITLGAITFGVMALILSGGFVEDVFIQLREATIHSQLGHIQIERAGYAKYGRTDPYKYLLSGQDELARKLTAVKNIKDVLKRLNFSGLLSNGRADTPIIGEGIEPDKEARLGTFLQIHAGRQLNDADEFGILIGRGVARVLNLVPGDSVTLMSNTPDGALNTLEFTVIGVFQTFSKDYDDRAIRIPLPAAQSLLVTDSIHNFVLLLDATEHTDLVVTQLRRALSPKSYEVLSWLDLAEFYRSTVALYERQFGVLQLIILFMVILGVANSINMAIFERTGEFGTQRATGDRRSRVFHLIMTETCVLGILGAMLGLLMGVILALAISKLGIPMPPPPNSNTGYTAYIRIVPFVLVTAVAVGLLASIVAALIPAVKATRIPIADALRRNI